LRCECRLVNSDLELDARTLSILPRKHHLTELIVRDCHERVHHSGARATLAQLRLKYWVSKGRQEVKRVLSKCVTCKKLKGKPNSSPPAAALPEFRVRDAPPFSRGVTNRKPTHLSRPVQKLYPLKIKSKGEGLPPANSSVQKSRADENPTRTVPRRNAALDSQWKSRLMLDS